MMSRQSRTVETRSNFWVTALVLLVGFALTGALFLLTRVAEERRIEAQFHAEAYARVTSLGEKLLWGDLALAAIAAYRHAGGPWDARTFALLAAPHRERFAGIRALEWIPRVRSDERLPFERSMRRAGRPDFTIKERDSHGRLVAARSRAEYFPVAFVEPLKGNEPVLGFDLGSEVARLDALAAARDGGHSAATEPTVLLQASRTTFGTLVFWPVYRAGARADTPEARRENLDGFILAVYDISQLAKAALEPFARERGIHVTLLDPAVKGDPIYTDVPPDDAGPQRLRYAGAVAVGHRQWRALVTATPEFERQFGSALQWFILLGGGSFTLLTVFLLRALQLRSTKLRTLVRDRNSELERSHGLLRAILDTVVDGIITIDQTGNIRSANPAAERIFGYALPEMLGRNVSMLMPEPYASEHDGYLRNFTSSGVAKIIGIGREVTGRRKDGSIFPLDLSVSETTHSGQRFFTGIVRDITDRKRTQHELAETGGLREAILESANFSIISTSTDGVIQTFNSGAQRLLGYTQEEVVGRVTPAIIHDPDEVVARAKVLSRELGRTVEPGFEVFVAKTRMGLADENEWTYIRKDGSRFPVLLSVTALRDEHGTIIGFLGVGSDVTERKKMDKLKSDFVSTVSHELRTPLTSIRGALGLVLSRGSQFLPEKLRRMLEIANRNSERLSLLINDILDLEKLQTGRLPFELGPVDLADLLNEALEANDGYAKQHGVRLDLHDSVARGKVWGDRHRLLQVCANLISNAIKFSPPDGVVVIGMRPHQSAWRIFVQDRGPGIPEEFRGQIFQRFAQADNTDTREKGGTGLGLSIAKAIVERHDGTIGFENRDGSGTVFFFDLPKWMESTKIDGQAYGKARVLICEDNPDVAQILRELVETQGWASDTAATGAAAKSLLARGGYAVMLLDLNLPDTDGLSLLRELRDHESTRALPVVVVSGRAEDGRREQGCGDMMQVVDWIQKPVDESRLARALEGALRRVPRPRILHIEDDPDVAQVVQTLVGEMAQYEHATTLSGARERLEGEKFDLVLLDLKLQEGSGLDLLPELGGRCPVIIFSGEMPSRDVTRHVLAALSKATTGNDELLDTIRRALVTS